MGNKEKYNFQYCQKIVVFSKDGKSILLCKRKGEADYDGTYSFIGGKMETTDENIISSMKREKDEEVGSSFEINLYPKFSINAEYKKKDGSFMILPHYYSIHESGEIDLNEEYSDYKWVLVTELEAFEPKINNIDIMVKGLLQLKEIINKNDLISI